MNSSRPAGRRLRGAASLRRPTATLLAALSLCGALHAQQGAPADAARAIDIPFHAGRAPLHVTAPVPADMLTLMGACGFTGEAPQTAPATP